MIANAQASATVIDMSFRRLVTFQENGCTVKARNNDMSRAGLFDRYNTIIAISNALFTWVPKRGLLGLSLYRDYRYIGIVITSFDCIVWACAHRMSSFLHHSHYISLQNMLATKVLLCRLTSFMSTLCPDQRSVDITAGCECRRSVARPIYFMHPGCNLDLCRTAQTLLSPPK
jgi:hypothetical protein